MVCNYCTAESSKTKRLADCLAWLSQSPDLRLSVHGHSLAPPVICLANQAGVSRSGRNFFRSQFPILEYRRAKQKPKPLERKKKFVTKNSTRALPTRSGVSPSAQLP